VGYSTDSASARFPGTSDVANTGWSDSVTAAIAVAQGRLINNAKAITPALEAAAGERRKTRVMVMRCLLLNLAW
jgi:hypothetical protein